MPDRAACVTEEASAAAVLRLSMAVSLTGGVAWEKASVPFSLLAVGEPEACGGIRAASFHRRGLPGPTTHETGRRPRPLSGAEKIFCFFSEDFHEKADAVRQSLPRFLHGEAEARHCLPSSDMKLRRTASEGLTSWERP